MSIDLELLDELAELEVKALLEGLRDEEQRKNPSFLEKVRKFLVQNKLRTDPSTPGVSKVVRDVEDIPDFDSMN